MDVQHVLLHDPIAAEPARVAVIADLEHSAADVDGMPLEKTLDVMTVDWRSAAVAEIAAERGRAAHPPTRHDVAAVRAAKGPS